MLHSQPEPVHIVGQLCLSRVGGGSEQPPGHIRLPEGTQGIDDQYIRIQIDDPVQLLRQQAGRQQTIVHLRRITAAHRSAPEQVPVHPDGVKFVSRGPAPSLHCLQHMLRQVTVQQVDVEMLPRIIQPQRCEQHAELRKIILIKSDQDIQNKSSLFRVILYFLYQNRHLPAILNICNLYRQIS